MPSPPLPARRRVLLALAAATLAVPALAEPAGGAAVTLSGGVTSGPSVRRSRALLAVELPLDAPARPAAPRAARSEEPAPRLVRQRGPSLRQAVGGVRAAATAVGPHAAPFPDGGFTRGAIRAAWRAAGLGHDRHLDDLAGRARLAATLPELTLGVERTTDESLRLTPTLDDPYRHTQAGGESITLEGRLRWRLDRVLFVDEELALERVRTDRARLRAELARRVLEALMRWVRAVRGVEEARTAGVDAADPALAEAELALLEAELALDALTGGWFERQRSRRRR